MYFLGLGVILLIMKWMEFGAVAAWNWWVVLSPFGLAVAWWTWADASGYTKRKAMEQEDAKRKERVERNREAMGMLSAKRRRK